MNALEERIIREKDRLIKEKEKMIRIILKNSPTDELITMHEHGGWNEVARNCFIEELENRGVVV